MFKKAKNEANTYGIVGLGRFGHALAMELALAGTDILVIDRDEEKVSELREYTDNAFIIKTLDRKTLAQTGIQNCEIAVVCIGEHMDTSILTTLNLINLGIEHVIAKATSLEHGMILEKLGAEVVYPERDMAIRLAHRLETSKMLDFVQLSEKLNISKLESPEKIVGKSIASIDLRKKFAVNIIALENANGLMETVLPEYKVQNGDILYLAGSRDALNKISDWAEKR